MFENLNEKEKKLRDLEVRYIIVGKEICPKSGKEHLQGYLYYEQPVSLKYLKENVDEKAHWENQKGTTFQASEYCKKDGQWWEQGDRPSQGQRNDFHTVAELVHKGASLQWVAENHPGVYAKYHRGLVALKVKLMKKRSTIPEITWIWGKSGVGKTKYASEKCSSFYMKDGTKWWDNYEQEDCIIIDNFDGKWPFRDFLRLLDRYPYQGESKFGYLPINSPYIVITCEFPPSHFWKDTELHQIERRITHVIHLEQHKVCTEVDGNTAVNFCTHGGGVPPHVSPP